MRGPEHERADIALDALRRGQATATSVDDDEANQLGAIEGIAAGVAVSIGFWVLAILAAAKLMR